MSTEAGRGQSQLPVEAHLEPRCRVCRNDTVRTKVNTMLAGGKSFAMIVRALADDNAASDPRDRVTIDSVRNHSTRHFPVQNAAQATYRAILERRAREHQVDFVNGMATAITPLAYLETVMVRGYEALVSPETRIDVRTAVAAAAKLHTLIEARAEHADIAEAIAKQNRIISAVRNFVPADKHDELFAHIEGQEAALSGTEEPESTWHPRTYEPDSEDDDTDF